ncbi:MAG: ABC transporter permease [Candidatus Hodarchaeales archaeon]|jgi:putative ABC transport system permease protein
MRFLQKKIWREIKNSKMRSFLVILSVSLSIALYGSLDLLEVNVQNSRTHTYTEYSYEDAAFRVIGYAQNKSFSNISTLYENIIETDTRLSVFGTVTIDNEDFNGVVHGINPSIHPKVNDFSILSGHFFSSHPLDEVLIESHFAETQNVRIGDELSVNLAGELVDVTVVGIVFSPEYMFVVNPQTSLPEPGSYCPVWMDIERIQNILQQEDAVNEFFITVNKMSELDDTIDQVKAYLDEEKNIVTRVKRGDKEADYLLMDEDIKVLVNFSIAFSLIVLIVTVVIIYDSLTKMIASQRTIIGILRSLGATKTTIVFHYLRFILILTLLGVILSLPLGYALSLVFRDVYVNLIGLKYVSSIFKLQAFMNVSVVAIGVALISGFTIALKSASVMPSEAMKGVSFKGKYKKAPLIERITDFFSRNHRFSGKIPIRNVFSRKKRSFITALTIAVSTLIILSSFGAINSATHQVDIYFENRVNYNLEIYFSAPMDLDVIESGLQNIAGIDSFAGLVRQPVVINTSSKENPVIMAAYPENSDLRSYFFKQGELEEGKVILGRKLADELEVSVGDIITLKTQGYSQNAVAQQNYEVSGTLYELFDNEVYMNLETAQKLTGLGNNVTAIAVQANGNKNIVKQDIKNSSLPISMVQDNQQTKVSIEKLLEGMITVAGAVSVVGLVILIIFSLNIIILDVLERDREFVNLRISGGNWWVVSKVITVQIFLIAILVIMLFIPLTQFSTTWLNKEIASDFMTITTFIAPLTFLFGLIILLIGLSIGIAISIRHILRVKLADITRVRFQT